MSIMSFHYWFVSLLDRLRVCSEVKVFFVRPTLGMLSLSMLAGQSVTMCFIIATNLLHTHSVCICFSKFTFGLVE